MDVLPVLYLRPIVLQAKTAGEAFPDHPAEAQGDASAGWSESDRVSAWPP
jgi:hypothetical protein